MPGRSLKSGIRGDRETGRNMASAITAALILAIYLYPFKAAPIPHNIPPPLLLPHIDIIMCKTQSLIKQAL
jgi:hypothetical protein